MENPYLLLLDLSPALTASRRTRPWMKTIVSFAHVQVGDMRIDFRRRNVRVTEHRLH